MRCWNRTIVAAVSCVFGLGAGGAFGQDWPQWRGPNRDGKVTGFVAPREWPTELTRKWRVTVGLGPASPALVDGKVFVFTRRDVEEVTVCLNAVDGSEIWRAAYPAKVVVTGLAGAHPGPRSSPAVAEGKVVTFGVGGIVSCLDAATGRVVWRTEKYTKSRPRNFTGTSPLIVDGTCVLHVGGRGDGQIVALDLASGAERWSWKGDPPAYASPVLMTVDGVKQVVAQTERNVVGIGAADGKLLWQVPAAVQGRLNNSVTPVVDGQTVIFTGQGKGTRAVRVERRGDAFAVTSLWHNAKVGTTYNTPVLKDGLLFGLSDRGNLFCLSAPTGETLWTDETKLSDFGAILDAGPVMLVLPTNSELIAYRPDGARFERVARFKVADTPTYATPIVAGNRVFVKDQETIAMFAIE